MLNTFNFIEQFPLPHISFGTFERLFVNFVKAFSELFSGCRVIELIRKDLGYWENEMTRTKEDFTREMTRMATELAEAAAFVDASRDSSYKTADTVRQNSYDIKELTRQLNGGW